jgi:NTP pyrophosphatase (non-canonical NTP hydrolase)
MTTTPQTKMNHTTVTINEAADAVHYLAWEKGWHSKEENEDAFVERMCNNLHDEVSELHEAWRSNHLRDLCDKSDAMTQAGLTPLTCLEEELADIVIRAFDNSRRLGVDIAAAIIRKHQFNATRSQRHGGKRS